jgi:hypothetical protein
LNQSRVFVDGEDVATKLVELAGCGGAKAP